MFARRDRSRGAGVLAGLALAWLFAGALFARAEEPDALGSPVACELGRACFVQQLADMAPGPEAEDPFCASATYDGHDGTDIRVLSMADVSRGVDVIAVTDGEVLRMRDGVPDRLLRTEEDRLAIRDRECGNGMIVERTDGLQVQYCHLKEGSLVVAPGDEVKRGEKLGQVGASGGAEFPHVHITVSRDGKPVEPATGRVVGEGCAPAGAKEAPLFRPEVLAAIVRDRPQLLASGVTDAAVEEDRLVSEGPPPVATARSAAVVGWGWVINLDKGDELTVRLFLPDGSLFSEQAVPPLERSKATYVAYAGRKRHPAPGEYEVEVVVKRGGETILSSRQGVTVR